MDKSVAELKRVSYVDRVYDSLHILSLRDQASPSCFDLRLAEHRVFSQNGEDGVIDALIRLLDPPQFFVEFGVGDGWSCNTRLLAEVREWQGLYIEVDGAEFNTLEHRYRYSESVACMNAAVTPLNASEIFRNSSVPHRFGVLSIDIDGQDIWVWNALSEDFRPDIVVIEFNAEHQPGQMTVESEMLPFGSDLGYRWGASLDALISLASAKGYVLVHVEMARVNAFFVASEVLQSHREQISGRTSPGSPNYGLRGSGLSDGDAFPSGNRADRPNVQFEGPRSTGA